MLKRNLSKALIVIVLIVLFAGPSWARIWQVAKDDSGEFQVIQDAVNAATAGDTIQIGPGRYTEYTIDHSRELAWYVRCQDKGLTFFGSTEGETIIGHTEAPISYRYTMFGIGSGQGSQASEYRNITFEIVQGQGISTLWGSLIVEDCKFINSKYGVVANAPYGGYVRNCYVENLSQYGILFHAPSNGIIIENCVVVNTLIGISSFWACENITVLNCTISGGRAGIGFVSGASGRVKNCTVTGADTYCFWLGGAGTVLIEDCHTVADHESGGSIGLGLTSGPGNITVRRSVFTASGTNAAVAVIPPGFTLDIKGNHFLRTNEEAFFVKAFMYQGYTGPLVHIDLTGNYWGTTDPDVIESGIADVLGVEDTNYVVDFLPLLPNPVPTEKTTMGGMKALFR